MSIRALLVVALLLAGSADSALGQGRLLVQDYPSTFGWLWADGTIRAFPVPLKARFMRVLLNDPGHLLLGVMSSHRKRGKLAVVPLDGRQAWTLPIPKGRKRAELVSVIRYLPAQLRVLFSKSIYYMSRYLLLDKRARRRPLRELRRFRPKLFESHILASGAAAMLYSPAFNARTERSGSPHYSAKNPKVEQTLYVGRRKARPSSNTRAPPQSALRTSSVSSCS
jgi:hypothetical protein